MQASLRKPHILFILRKGSVKKSAFPSHREIKMYFYAEPQETKDQQRQLWMNDGPVQLRSDTITAPTFSSGWEEHMY